jgi:CRP-like cAMP-binding protein
MSNVALLRKSDLFSRFDDATLERIGERFTEVEVPPNQVLIEPRTTGAGLYVICDGTVTVDAHGMERELGAGEIVGEISLIDEDATRRARVTAKTPVRCLALGRADFEQLVNDVPELGRAIRELAQKRLAQLNLG